MTAVLSLKVVIIGGGIGGIAAALALARRGHKVVLLEAAPVFLEIGSGIQVAPNMLRILDRWGVGEIVRKKGTMTEDIRVLRWKDGQELGRLSVTKDYGDQVTIHRADLHNALLSKAKELPNFTLRLGFNVAGINFENGEVTSDSGERVQGDVVLAADGIKSFVRSEMSGEADHAIPTGDAAYRIILTRAAMGSDPELKIFLEKAIAYRWIGPSRHIMAYPVRNFELFNMVLVHPDRGGFGESWNTPGSKKELIQEYEGWDPRLIKMLKLVPDNQIVEWKLCSHAPLSTWVKGRVALLGDACHPMLPYVAQGAAQAIEDAATLDILLSKMKSKSNLASTLATYEQARKVRAETIQQLGPTTRSALHLPDGPAQEQRDAQMKNLKNSGGQNPDKWGDANTQKFLWGWDAEEAAQVAWKGAGVTVQSVL